jgi:hypothetical protein
MEGKRESPGIWYIAVVSSRKLVHKEDAQLTIMLEQKGVYYMVVEEDVFPIVKQWNVSNGN